MLGHQTPKDGLLRADQDCLKGEGSREPQILRKLKLGSQSSGAEDATEGRRLTKASNFLWMGLSWLHLGPGFGGWLAYQEGHS